MYHLFGGSFATDSSKCGGVTDANSPPHISLAVMAGVITVTPLVLFHAGNRSLSMIMGGLVFYANPTTQLLLGLYFFAVPVTTLELLSFAMIWIGVLVYFSTRRRGATKNSHPKVAVGK